MRVVSLTYLQPLEHRALRERLGLQEQRAARARRAYSHGCVVTSPQAAPFY